MKLIDNEYFLKQWKVQLEQVSYILQYLHTYPDMLSDLNIQDLIIPEELYKQQEEWLWLCSKLTGMEQEFFKPYWIPIQRCGYDYFIDISNERYPIIEAFFDSIDEPYYWEKKILFRSIKQLMLADDYKVNLEQYRVKKILEKYRKYFS